jgi:hypothetical protein
MACSGLAERRVAFAVVDRDFDWSDLVAAAQSWGDWSRIGHDAKSALLSIERARASGLALEGPEFDAEAHRFRYARHLLSADELERWLAERGLDVEGWLEYIRGVLLSGSLASSRLSSSNGSAPPAAVWTRAVCSGSLAQVAERLAGRVAVSVATRGPLPAGHLSDTDLRELDRCFDRFCARSAAEAAVTRELERHLEDWTEVDLHRVITSDEHVAREVALCVRVDGRPLADVAEDAGLALERRSVTLEQVQEPLRTSLLGAARQELIGPLTITAEYWLVEVLERRTPSLDRADVARRARGAAIEQAVRREVAERVRWHDCP